MKTNYIDKIFREHAIQGTVDGERFRAMALHLLRMQIEACVQAYLDNNDDGNVKYCTTAIRNAEIQDEER